MQTPFVLAVTARAAAAIRSTSIRGAALAAAACLSAALAGCWDDGPIPFQEEEIREVIIGSAEAGAGSLVAEFDFDLPILVDYNTELGGFTVYSGTVPGFVPLGPNVEDGPPFGFPDGTVIGMRITAIDEGIQIIFGDTVLAMAGDAVDIGASPFDLHPEWQLVHPTGSVPPPRLVSFVLTTTAAGYTESAIYTATIAVEAEEE